MIKNKKIIAALCAAAVVTGITTSVSAETTTGYSVGSSSGTSLTSDGAYKGTTGSGYTYGQISEGQVMASDGTMVNVSIGNTYGATEDQKRIYENFANYLDNLKKEYGKDLKQETIDAIKTDAAYIIINGGDPTDGNYYLNNSDVDYDATLVLNVTGGYDTNTKYVSSASITNTIEEKLIETSSGGGTVTKQEVTSTVTQALKIESTNQNAALLSTLFLGQTTDSVQAAINSGTLNKESANIIKQVQGTNSSINGVIYGNQTFNDFCETRGLSYQDAVNYIISLGKMDPEDVPAIDKELASAVNNLFNITDGAAHDMIVENMMSTMNKTNQEIAEAQAYLRDLVITEVNGKKVVIVVDEVAGTGYIDSDSGEFVKIGTIGEGTKYVEGIAYSYANYFNEEHYDGEKLFASLQILFPGCDISGYYESYINAPNPIPDDFGEQITRMIQEIQTNYYGEGGPGEGYTKIPLYGGCKPESFLITTANVSGTTSDIVTEVAASKEVHRTVDTMVFELQRFDGLPIMDEERAKTDADIFANLYNMYFTPEVREQERYSDSMFTILDTYMQLHAQTYGKVGMPPITTKYENDTVIYTIDFKTGIQKMASAVGVSYEDFVRNYFSYYVRPSANDWYLDPSQHTYSFYPQETTTTYIPTLTQSNRTTGQVEPYYIGTIHKDASIRGNTLKSSQIFQNARGILRGIGIGSSFDDTYLKTDSVRPVLLTLRPEISSVYNVHVYTTGTYFEDLPNWINASDNRSADGKTWYYYPYREIFMTEGGSFANCAVNYAESWGPVTSENELSAAKKEQNKLTLKNGAEVLVDKIISTNNEQFTTGRGDIAAYYNYVIYNGVNTSNMAGAYSQGVEDWINNTTKALTSEENAAINESRGSILPENFQYNIYEEEGIKLKVPLDKNGRPLYNITYGIIKCAYSGDFNGYVTQMNMLDDLKNAFGNVTDAEARQLFANYGINLPESTNPYYDTISIDNTFWSYTPTDLMSMAIYSNGDLSFLDQFKTNEGISTEGDTVSSETSEVTSPQKKTRVHGSEDDALPDECYYYAECCTRWFVATWNSMATVPYVVMDDVAPKIYDSATLISQPYESERVLQYPIDNDDSVFHWRWSQTLEADPSPTTTSFTTTTATLPILTETNPITTTSATTTNDNPYDIETTYRTTSGSLPPIPTPITIPSDDDDNKKVIIEKFISK